MSLIRLFSIVFACLGLAASGIAAEPLRVGAAASLKEAVTDVVRAFETRENVKVEATFNASGLLAAQIRAGAPIDVFLSAGVKEVDDLAATRLVDETSRVVVSTNELVLIVPAGAKSSVTTLSDLAGPSVKRVAIGQPKVVPAGLYASQAFESLKLTGSLKDKLVYGQNVRQVLDYVARGEVDAGLVYRTDANTSKDVTIVSAVDQATHQPIQYLAVVVTGTKLPDEAKAFVQFLTSADAQALFQKRGFNPTTRPAQK